jgi:hypothetical protein
MGEMADFALDDVVSMEERRSQFYNSQMSDQEAFENGFLGPAGHVSNLAGEPEDYTDLLTYEDSLSLLNSLENTLTCGVGLESKLRADFISRGGHVIRLGDSPTKPKVELYTGNKEREWIIEKLKQKFSTPYILKIMKQWTKEDGTLFDASKNIKTLAQEKPLVFEAIKFLLKDTFKSNIDTEGRVTNEEAVKVAKTCDNPHCNICRKEMSSKIGRFGKFYFCSNKCKGQPTVSDTYWQKYKKSVKGL